MNKPINLSQMCEEIAMTKLRGMGLSRQMAIKACKRICKQILTDMQSQTKNPAAVSLGRIGGKSTSKAKAAASRANGTKGGRPRKQKAHNE